MLFLGLKWDNMMNYFSTFSNALAATQVQRHMIEGLMHDKM
jgi:hypothetical protein